MRRAFNQDARSNVELSRKKILLRKYGYMFYRRAISTILPSQVEKLREVNRKRRTFTAWKSLWLDERAGWRLAIRANLHYAFALKRNTFKKWQLQLMRRKTKRIQFRIASTYYAKKLKTKSLHRLLYYVKCYKHIETLRRILIEQFVLRFLTLEVINDHRRCIDIQVTYHLKEFARDKKKTRCFAKLLDHANEQIHEKNNLLRARLLFKRKNYPGMLRPFFAEWRSYAAESSSKKFKTHLALDHFRNKILKRCLLKLYHRRNYGQTKRNNYALANDVYEINLKARCFKCLHEFTSSRIKKRIKTDAAVEFYARKITLRCFVLLVKHKKHRREKKDVLLEIDAQLERKIKAKALQKLKNHRVARKTQEAKTQIAVDHHENKIKRVCFKELSIFCGGRKVENHKKITAASAKREGRLLRVCFAGWKRFRRLKTQKRIKTSLAVRKFQERLTKKTLLALKQHATRQKSARKTKETRLASSTVTKWRKFVARRFFYRSKLQEASLFYKKRLVKRGLNAILTAAYRRQESRKTRLLEIVERQLALARKYFAIWKRKATRNEICGCVGNRENFLDEVHRGKSKSGCEVADEVVPFVWNHLCFEGPKIPDYLLKSIQNL